MLNLEKFRFNDYTCYLINKKILLGEDGRLFEARRRVETN